MLPAIAAGLIAGIVAERYGAAPVCLAVATVLAAIAYIPEHAWLRTAWSADFTRAPAARRLTLAARRLALTVAIAVAGGVLACALHKSSVSVERRGRTSTFSGTVVAVPQTLGFGAEFPLLLDDGTVLQATASGDVPAVGERVLVRGRAEPFDEARNPGEPSLRALETDRGIAGRLAHARVLARAPPDPHDPATWLPLLRAWASAQLHASLDEPAASILAGAMWGERGMLPPDLRAEFQDTGTTHVLVTAGLHLGVIAALAAWLFARAGIARVPAVLLTIVAVWSYAAFSGAHLPSLRAATMLSFALVARACGRAVLSWNALAAAVIVIALVWTPSVASLSFALSFSCVAAIVLFAKPVAHALERAHLGGFAGEAIALTVATQLGTWPLTAYAFLVFAPYAPLANALVVPTIALAMLVGVALLVATPVHGLAVAIANIEESLLQWVTSVVRTAANAPGAHVIATPPPLWAIATYDACAVACALLLARRAVVAGAAVLLAGAALVAWPPRPASHDLVVTAIDVGQADGLLIRTPAGHAYLVDAGGRLERGGSALGGSPAEAIGERVVVPFLVRAGIHHVDAILLSHPHGDHAGGVAPVLRTLGSGAFADSGQTYPGHAYHDALDVAAHERIPLVYPRAGTVYTTDDGVTFRFYSPSLPLLRGTQNDINNNSLVFRLEYRAFRMLFTGDAGAEAEERILSSGADIHADVLKVGHHGSRYSSTPAFIRAVKPRYAIVSVGRDNLFGHPAPATIETLQNVGARVFRTDEDGAVTVASDGNPDGTNVRAFLPTP